MKTAPHVCFVNIGRYKAGGFDGHAIGSDMTKLFCRNPQSYKYEEHDGYGTAATILCEYYAPLMLTEGTSEATADKDAEEEL